MLQENKDISKSIESNKSVNQVKQKEQTENWQQLAQEVT